MNGSMCVCGPICSAFSLRSHWGGRHLCTLERSVLIQRGEQEGDQQERCEVVDLPARCDHGLHALLEQQRREAPRLVGHAAARAASLADAEHHRVSVVQPVDIARPRDPTMTSVARGSTHYLYRWSRATRKRRPAVMAAQPA
jgi:hypothetical protein